MLLTFAIFNMESQSMYNMIWCTLWALAAKLTIATANPSPVASDSANLFDLDSGIQAGFSTNPGLDGSGLSDSNIFTEAKDNGDDSTLFDPTLLNFNIPDDSVEQLQLASTFDDLALNFDDLALTPEGLPCGTQSSSDALFSNEPELALDLPDLGILDARGFFEDVNQLQNEVLDQPNGNSCPSTYNTNSNEQSSQPRVNPPGRKIDQDLIPAWNFASDLDVYFEDEFGKCPARQPEYTKALCCTGFPTGIYVLRCAPGTIFFALFSPFR